MALVNTHQWKALEGWSPTLFLVAGIMFVVDAGIVVTGMALDSERLIMLLGQAFVGAGWTAALLGLLGLFPRLADQSRWLARTGALFAVIGAVTFAVMAVAALVYFAGIPEGEVSAIIPFFIPGVLLGSVLGFITFSMASFLTGVYSRTISLLLLVLPLIVITNLSRGAAGIESHAVTLGIVGGLAVVHSAIGYLLRVDSRSVDQMEPAPDAPPQR